jgi:hypothetical protein
VKYTQKELGITSIRSIEEIRALTRIKKWRRHSLRLGIEHVEEPKELFDALMYHTNEDKRIQRAFWFQDTLWYESEEKRQ